MSKLLSILIVLLLLGNCNCSGAMDISKIKSKYVSGVMLPFNTCVDSFFDNKNIGLTMNELVKKLGKALSVRQNKDTITLVYGFDPEKRDTLLNEPCIRRNNIFGNQYLVITFDFVNGKVISRGADGYK